MNVTLAPGLLEEITNHARSVLPKEGCGLVIGANGMGARFIPMRNALESETAYEIDPAQLVGVLRSLRDTGEEIVAICHSHPNGPAEPSERDIRQAYYPRSAQLIVSLADPEHPVARVFRIAEGEAVEIELHVIV